MRRSPPPARAGMSYCSCSGQDRAQLIIHGQCCSSLPTGSSPERHQSRAHEACASDRSSSGCDGQSLTSAMARNSSRVRRPCTSMDSSTLDTTLPASSWSAWTQEFIPHKVNLQIHTDTGGCPCSCKGNARLWDQQLMQSRPAIACQSTKPLGRLDLCLLWLTA